MTTSIFVQSAGAPEGRSELARVFGGGTVQRVVSSAARRRGATAAIQRGAGLLLHQLARTLYLSPLLVVLSLVLRAAGGPAWFVVVVFCLLVVLFFVVLNVFVVSSLLAWLRSRKQTPNARWNPFEPRMLRPASGTVVQGRVERIDSSADAVVVRDFWADAEVSWRVTECAVFRLRPDDPSAEPVVVACTTAPDSAGHGVPMSGAEAVEPMSPEARTLLPPTLGPDTRGLGMTITAGDHVEIRASSSDPIENLARIPLPGGEVLALDAEGATYRDQPDASPQGGRLLRDTVEAPLAIQRLS